MPLPTRSRRRTVAACLLTATLAVPLLVAPNASGDGIVDKRVEAQRISARLDTLRTRVEILAEEFDNARIELAAVRTKVRSAKRAMQQTNREVSRRQRDLARFAVNAYTSADDSAATIDLVLKGAGSDLGTKDGYASATVGDKADLVDSLRAAKSDNDSRLAELRRAEKQSAAAEATMAKKRKAAAAAVAETKVIYDRVQGELKRLVAAEQARAAAAQQARAEATARAAGARARVADQASAARRSVPTSGRRAAPAPRATTRRAAPAPAPRAPAPASAPVGQGAGAAIAAARSVLGVRYTWGGASPATGFDCSGLVMWAWAHGGKSLPHSSRAMYGAARRIPISSLQPGDLVFYGSPIHHVALYIGGGSIIHAPHTGSYVQVASLYYWKDLVGAGRV